MKFLKQPYLNPDMETVRQVALKNEYDIYENFIKDLDYILDHKTFRSSTVGCEHKYSIEYPSEDLIKKIKKEHQKELEKIKRMIK